MKNYTEAALAAIRYLKSEDGFIGILCKTSRYLILEFDKWIFRVAKCGLVTQHLKWGLK